MAGTELTAFGGGVAGPGKRGTGASVTGVTSTCNWGGVLSGIGGVTPGMGGLGVFVDVPPGWSNALFGGSAGDCCAQATE
jgi:hypothetical protein